MVKKCFVPNCISGYATCTERVSIFKAPSNEELLDKWRRAIPRADRQLSPKDFVCEKHFVEGSIITRRIEKLKGNVLYDIPVRARLAPNAIPSIFHNCPAYLSKTQLSRKPPSNRKGVLKVSQINTNQNPTPIDVVGFNYCTIDNLTQTSGNNLAFSNLVSEARNLPLPSLSWGVHSICSQKNENFVSFCDTVISAANKLVITKNILFDESMQCTIFILNKAVCPESSMNIPKTFQSLTDVKSAIQSVHDMHMCPGHPDSGGCGPNKSSDIHPESAFIDDNGFWRHKKCKLFVRTANTQCTMCRVLRNTFRLHLARKRKGGTLQRFRLSLSPTQMAKVTKIQNARNYVNKRLKICHVKTKHVKNELKLAKSQLMALDKTAISNQIEKLNLSSAQQMLINECISVGKKASKNGRRYTSDWLLLCLLIHIRNTSMYKFLYTQRILPLPCITTIHKYLNTMDAKCGFDSSFFAALKIKLSKYTDLQRHGMIVFDEIQVRKSLAVNSQQMTYNGLVNFGETVQQNATELADHGLVIMFRPFADSWAQPVAVFASKGPTKSIILTQLLLRAIMLLEEAGAIVDGIVCDGASTNRGIWKEFGIKGKLGEAQSSFTHPVDEARKIYMFSDAPHLIKCIRNRLQSKKELKIGSENVKWCYYENMFDEEKKMPGHLRICPKITLAHINPSNSEKMRVKLATQIFSNSVAAGLRFYSRRYVKNMHGANATISFTLQINNMFDALNRRSPCEGVRIESNDIKMLHSSLKWLDSWEEELKSGKICRDEFLTPSTAEGLRVSLLSTVQLTEHLLQCGFSYVLTGKFNQDVIERFFGTVRQAAGQNEHPSMPTFLQLYKILSMYSILRPPKFGNCSTLEASEKPSITFQEFREIFQSASDQRINFVEQLKCRLDGLISEGIWECDDIFEHNYHTAEAKDCVLYYVTGFISKKLSKFTNCNICKKALLNPVVTSEDPVAQLTNIKTRGKLLHPNITLFYLLSNVEKVFSENSEKTDVYWVTLNHIMDSFHITFPCVAHKYEMMAKILHYYISMRMRQYCHQKNFDSGRVTKEKRKLSKLYCK